MFPCPVVRGLQHRLDDVVEVQVERFVIVGAGAEIPLAERTHIVVLRLSGGAVSRVGGPRHLLFRIAGLPV